MFHEDGVEVYLKPVNYLENQNPILPWEGEKQYHELRTRLREAEWELGQALQAGKSHRSEEQQLGNEDGPTEQDLERLKGVRDELQEQVNLMRKREEEARLRFDKHVVEDKIFYEGLRFPELSVGDEDTLRKRCYVPAIRNRFEVVVRFSEEFDLFSADSVRVVLSNNAQEEHVSASYIEQRSRVGDQQLRIQEAFLDDCLFDFPMDMEPNDGKPDSTVVQQP